MKKIFFSMFVLCSVFVLFFLIAISNNSAIAYTANNASGVPSSLINPLDFVGGVTKGLTGPSGIGGNAGTTLPSLSNLNTLTNGISGRLGGLSTSDLTGSLKAIASLAINLFLIVIQTVSGILKALLPFLNK